MTRYYPENPDQEKECMICGSIFIGKKNALFCSDECRKKNEMFAKEYAKHKEARKRKYARLLHYVEENNMREILKKYKPKRTA